jgi:hypothetical protein
MCKPWKNQAFVAPQVRFEGNITTGNVVTLLLALRFIRANIFEPRHLDQTTCCLHAMRVTTCRFAVPQFGLVKQFVPSVFDASQIQTKCGDWHFPNEFGGLYVTSPQVKRSAMPS